MIFRTLFIFSYVFFTLNIGRIFHVGGSNALEKGFFLLAALAFVMTRKVDGFVLFLCGVIMLMVFTLGAMTGYPGFQWSYLINGVNQFLILYALLAGVPQEEDKDSVVKAVAFFPLFCIGLSVLYSAAGLTTVFQREFASGIFRLAGTLNPAFLSGFAMCGTFGALIIALGGQRSYFALVATNFIILLAASGRMALVVTVFICVGAIVFDRNLRPARKLVLLASGFVAALPIAGLFAHRMLTRIQSSGDNGRDLLWGFMESLSDRFPWTGIGYGHQFWSTPRSVYAYTGSAAAHNDYLRLQLELGHVGVYVFYLCLTVAVLWVALRPKYPGGPLLLVGYVGFLLLALTDNALATPPYFPLIFIGYIAGMNYQHRSRVGEWVAVGSRDGRYPDATGRLGLSNG